MPGKTSAAVSRPFGWRRADRLRLDNPLHSSARRRHSRISSLRFWSMARLPRIQEGARLVSQPSAPEFWLLLADDENSLHQSNYRGHRDITGRTHDQPEAAN